MSLQAPSWLNAEFLQNILKKSQSDESIEVTHVTTKSATMTGDNYLSDMIRTGVEYFYNNTSRREKKAQSLIIKVAPTMADGNKEMVAELGVFDTEIKMMEDTLIKMNELLNEEGYRLSARVLYTEIGDPSILVIEDLAPLGYVMADRQTGLDFEHCTLVIRRLAKFHATSVAVCEKHPKTMDMYQRGIFHDDNPEEFKKIFTNEMRNFAKEVVNWSELGSSRRSYSEKLLKISEVYYDRAVESYKPRDGEFNVLNHGDVWVNNMLFRYNNDGNVTDHVFVDFQMCSWGSPAVDISRFLNTTISEDMELHHQPFLLQEYLKTLTETMSRLRCNTKPPNMSHLNKMMKDRQILAIVWSAVGLPFMLIDRSEARTLDQIANQGDDYVNPVFKSLTYRKIMIRRLSAWNAGGFLEF